ncbi:unnamed protein product (macronuclear) [Paramecium tetraurelia]|uniref:CCT domain-containing protein n=1 Tax=Paramecium tetraurelia TaxID=5888 RepID=A0BFG4_PARTE|nr:uncharacterized protein GSPATT00028316001 [Paramecium tetraurelia]CAK57281.1 unnamed protein product [Paramecium tetraurelia]|eukprot:XP_001424679.1 hypothetical protein (macronuclear) [Paramecium tetraurelia strain d4-2]
MISEYKKGYPQNPNSINDMINNDVLDSSLDNLKMDPYCCVDDNFDEIGEQEIGIIIDSNLQVENPLNFAKLKYDNPNKISNMKSIRQRLKPLNRSSKKNSKICEMKIIGKSKTPSRVRIEYFKRNRKRIEKTLIECKI